MFQLALFLNYFIYFLKDNIVINIQGEQALIWYPGKSEKTKYSYATFHEKIATETSSV